MRKYMRKRAGRAPAAELAQAQQVVVGVSTRARSAASAAPAPAPKRPRKHAAPPLRADQARPAAEAGRGDGGAAAAGEGCYLQLRSRRLLPVAAATAEVRCPVAALPAAAVQLQSAASEEPAVVVAGASRCSSTASSVDVAAAATLERSGHHAAEARGEDRDVESAVSDSAGCWCRRREGREATPSSRPPVELSDEEWSQQAAADEDDPKHHCRRMPLATAAAAAAAACRARTMPRAEEIDEFFAAAEKAEAERFAARYNFDVARGLPLGAGRFEWTPVASA